LPVSRWKTLLPNLCPAGDALPAGYKHLDSLPQRRLVIGGNDLIIASIALAHGLTVVTHNSAEFSRVPGLSVEDWAAV
jgi:predicted nucleic acid-binding protein